MNKIIKYNKARGASGAAGGSSAAFALSALANYITQNQLSAALAEYLPRTEFDELFEKITLPSGRVAIRAKYGLYSEEFMSVLGANPDAGDGTLMAGATTLGGLTNVVAAADEVQGADRILVREMGASGWTLKNLSDVVGLNTAALQQYLTVNNYAKMGDIPSLAGYATEQWVGQQGFATESWVNGRGFLTEHQSLDAYLTKTEAASTYQPIGDYAMASALNSAVSSLTTAIGGKLDAAKFDELFEKVTLASGKVAIKAKYGLYSEAFMSVLGVNPDAGDGTVVGGGVDLDAVQSYLTQQGYATEAWVNSQGFLKSVSGFLPLTGGELSGRLSIITGQNECGIRFGGNTAADDFVGRYGTCMSLYNHNGNAEIKLHDNKTVAITGSSLTFNGTPVLTAHQSLDNYVDKTSAEDVGGVKTFTANVTNITRRLCVNGATTEYATYPEVMFHIANTEWVKLKMTGGGSLHLLKGGDSNWTQYATFKAASFVKNGGTGSQFLKADGSVDENSYALASALASYLRKDIQNFKYDDTTCATLDAVQNSANSWLMHYNLSLANNNNALNFYVGGGTNERVAMIQSGHNNNYYAAVLGVLHLNKLGGAVYINNQLAATQTWVGNNYVNKAGDTMSGALYFGSTNSGIYNADNVLALKAGDGLDKLVITADTVRRSTQTATMYLGTSDIRWANVYATTINVSSNALVSNLNADLLDGCHESSFLRGRGVVTTNQGNTLWSQIGIQPYHNALPDGLSDTYNYGEVVTFSNGDARFEFYCSHHSSNGYGLFFRSGWGGDKKAWKRLACITDNVASATKLQTTRYIYECGFDGTGNVNGTFHWRGSDATLRIYEIASAVNSDYGNETIGIQSCFDLQDPMTSAFPSTWPRRCLIALQPRGGRVAIGQTSADYPLDVNGDIQAKGWLRTTGGNGWYNQTHGGGWHMSDGNWIRAWAKPVVIGYVQNVGANSFGVGLCVENANNTSVEVVGGDYTMGLGCHKNGSWYWWRGTASGKSYVMQYNGSTWNFTGEIKTSTGVYSDGYMSCLGQNTGSDRAMKDIISGVDLPIEVIAGAPAVLFRWNHLAGPTMAGRLAVGTVAQYWEKHLPSVVSFRRDGLRHMLYAETAMVGLINVARYTKTEVETLKEKIKKLESRIAELEGRNVA